MSDLRRRFVLLTTALVASIAAACSGDSPAARGATTIATAPPVDATAQATCEQWLVDIATDGPSLTDDDSLMLGSWGTETFIALDLPGPVERGTTVAFTATVATRDEDTGSVHCQGTFRVDHRPTSDDEAPPWHTRWQVALDLETRPELRAARATGVLLSEMLPSLPDTQPSMPLERRFGRCQSAVFAHSSGQAFCELHFESEHGSSVELALFDGRGFLLGTTPLTQQSNLEWDQQTQAVESIRPLDLGIGQPAVMVELQFRSNYELAPGCTETNVLREVYVFVYNDGDFYSAFDHTAHTETSTRGQWAPGEPCDATEVTSWRIEPLAGQPARLHRVLLRSSRAGSSLGHREIFGWNGTHWGWEEDIFPDEPEP